MILQWNRPWRQTVLRATLFPSTKTVLNRRKETKLPMKPFLNISRHTCCERFFFPSLLLHLSFNDVHLPGFSLTSSLHCSYSLTHPYNTHIKPYVQSGNTSKDHCSRGLDKFGWFSSNQTEPITITLHIYAENSWNQNSDVIRIIIKKDVFTLKEVAYHKKIIFSFDFLFCCFLFHWSGWKGNQCVSNEWWQMDKDAANETNPSEEYWVVGTSERR